MYLGVGRSLTAAVAVALAALFSYTYAVNCSDPEGRGESPAVQPYLVSWSHGDVLSDAAAAAAAGAGAAPAADTAAATTALPSMLASPACGALAVARALGYVLAAASALVTVVLSAYAAVFAVPAVLTDAKARAAVFGAVGDTAGFYLSLYHYIVKGGSYPAPGHFEDCTQARVQIFQLAMVSRMWSVAHYRSGTFQNDMKKNLRNVAIPGTGVPLSVFCYSKVVAYAFLLVGYPLAALVSAINLGRGDVEKVSAMYREQLLCPQDWFSFWRLNCLLSTFHASLTNDKGYDMEDKWAFLQCADEQNIPVSPSLKVPKLIVKHRNEEGGLGLHSFTNAFVKSKTAPAGGDWLIQEFLENDEFVSSLLPEDAPLSTFRVVSQSRAGMPARFQNQSKGKGKGADKQEQVTALSCVFRAGREGAITDHVSVLYDVDMSTGIIGKGTTNQHWYQLGLDKPLTTAWNNEETTDVHPDTGRAVTGTKVDRLAEMLNLVEEAHAKMCPNVPLVGWDVAFTNKGMLLLEGNFSCNFFKGNFDKVAYFDFVNDFLTHLDQETAKAQKVQ
eukprot:SAG22_NODE_1892_length_3371_cov_2.789120_1_plen_559_part_00